MDNNNLEQPTQQPVQNEGQQPVQNEGQQPGKNLATASMILGIVTLVCIFFNVFAWIGIISGIVGLILGIKSKKQAPSGMATAGIVMSAIGLGLCVLTFVACLICIGGVASLGAAGINDLDLNNLDLNNLNLNY